MKRIIVAVLATAALAGAALFPVLPAVERFAGLRREEVP